MKINRFASNAIYELTQNTKKSISEMTERLQDKIESTPSSFIAVDSEKLGKAVDAAYKAVDDLKEHKGNIDLVCFGHSHFNIEERYNRCTVASNSYVKSVSHQGISLPFSNQWFYDLQKLVINRE